jgi:hypothetical protein
VSVRAAIAVVAVGALVAVGVVVAAVVVVRDDGGVAPEAAPTTSAGAATPDVPFPQTCDEPSGELSDPDAGEAARCVYDAIRRWAAPDGGPVPVGQQLNTARLHEREPVAALEATAAGPAVVGTDLDAILDVLEERGERDAPVVDDHVRDLVADAEAGRLVVVTWHADSPFTGGNHRDRDGVDLAALLDESTPAGAAWRHETDAALDVLRRFDEAGVAVAFRPFHEANLRSFWWGQSDPEIFRALWEQLRGRAEAAGLHDLVWVHSANHRWGDAVLDPLALVPERYDVFGLDAYDDERRDAGDEVPVRADDYRRIRELGKPFALTEVGPLGSADGRWDPSVVTDAVAADYPDAAWVMFWATFDDAERMAIVDLVGHEAWWSSCRDGVCPL